MNSLLRNTTLAFILTIASVVLVSANRFPHAQGQSQTIEPRWSKAQPVESSMHEFMEYVFQPTYKRLKQSIAVETTDKAAWKAIKADALSLAEAGNLLLLHSPKEDVTAWDELSIASREEGGKLYQAAKAKDYTLARQHYESMLTKCNACHDKFAEGKHQLTP